MGFQEYFEKQKAKNKALREKRMKDFYVAYRNKMINLADRTTGLVNYSPDSQKLTYTPGNTDSVQYVDLWNDFQTRARQKNIPIDKNTFDGIWQEFERMKNDKWLEAFDYANESGATQEHRDELFRDNEVYRKDALNVGAKAFPSDEFGEAARAEFISNITPSKGDDFMNRTEGWSIDKAQKWMTENPGWTAAGGAGAYFGAKKFGPGIMEWGKNIGTGKPGMGGLGPGMGTFMAGSGIKTLGEMAGMGDAGRVLGDAAHIGLGSRGLYNSLNVKGGSEIVRKRLASNLAKTSSSQLIANAKALGVDSQTIKSGGRKNASAKNVKVLQKAVKNKVLGQSLTKTMSNKGVSQMAVKAATKLGTKALTRTALASLGPIGLAANIGWGVYDLGDYMGWWGGDDEPQAAPQPEPVVQKPAYQPKVSRRTY